MTGTGLTLAERAKLAKLLGLLGSNHPGERDAAGLAAHRLVQSLGVTWRQVIEPAPTEKKLPELGTWRRTVAQLLEHPAALRPWERKFLHDLPQFRRLSTKQRYVLTEIRDRVLKEHA